MNTRSIFLVVMAAMLLLIVPSAGFTQDEAAKDKATDKSVRSTPYCAVWQSLTPDQRKQLKVLRVETAKRIAALRADLAQKRIANMELSISDKPDQGAVDRNRSDIEAIRDDIRKERRNMFREVRALLTPEQQQAAGLARGDGGDEAVPGCQCPRCMRMRHGMMGQGGGMAGHGYGMGSGRGMGRFGAQSDADDESDQGQRLRGMHGNRNMDMAGPGQGRGFRRCPMALPAELDDM